MNGWLAEWTNGKNVQYCVYHIKKPNITEESVEKRMAASTEV